MYDSLDQYVNARNINPYRARNVDSGGIDPIDLDARTGLYKFKEFYLIKIERESAGISEELKNRGFSDGMPGQLVRRNSYLRGFERIGYSRNGYINERIEHGGLSASINLHYKASLFVTVNTKNTSINESGKAKEVRKFKEELLDLFTIFDFSDTARL